MSVSGQPSQPTWVRTFTADTVSDDTVSDDTVSSDTVSDDTVSAANTDQHIDEYNIQSLPCDDTQRICTRES